MSAPEAVDGSPTTDSALWRGIDFSGLTLVLGVGTGRLIELLNQQTAASSGNLLVISANLRHLKPLVSLAARGPLALMQGRPRHIPILSETTDLVVVNGVLREIPDHRLEALFDEFWRVLVPGGRLRISDILEPSEAPYDRAWAERNRIVRKLGQVLQRPTALAVDLRQAAAAICSAGFEGLAISMLPGVPLTEAWVEETINALRNMAAGIVDRAQRHAILTQDIERLLAAYARGGQRAPERFVLQGTKVGDLALDMEASFTEQDLMEEPKGRPR